MAGKLTLLQILCGQNGAEKFITRMEDPSQNLKLSQSLYLPAKSDYTFSVWLWADKPTNLAISLVRLHDQTIIANTDSKLNGQPKRFFASGKTTSAGKYAVSISSLPDGELPESFYAWGTQLELGGEMTDYASGETVQDEMIRGKKPWLFVLNICALFLAMLFILRTRSIFLYDPIGIGMIALIAATFAQALLIIPEQRFVITFMVFIWALASTQISLWFDRHLTVK